MIESIHSSNHMGNAIALTQRPVTKGAHALWSGVRRTAMTGLMICALPFMAQAEAETDRVLRFVMDRFAVDYNPARSGTITSATILQNSFEPLIVRNPYGEIAPALADRWEVSDDRRRFRFHIRDGALWSDGTPITPESLKAGYEILIENGLLDEAFKESGDHVSVDAQGWLVFDFETARWPFMSTLAGMMALPGHLRGEVDFSTAWLGAPPEAMVYSGRYHIAEADEERVSLRPNPHFNGAHMPRNGGVDFILELTDRREVLEAYKSEEIDLALMISPASVAFLPGFDERYYQFVENPNLMMLVLNGGQKPFDNKKLRQAVAMATSLPEQARFLEQSSWKAHSSFVLDQFAPAYTVTYPAWHGWSVEKRLEEARAIMEDLGYSEQNPLQIEFSVHEVENERSPIATLLRSQWRQIYIDTEIVRRPTEAHFTTIIGQQHQIGQISWGFGSPNPFNLYQVFESESAFNIYGISDPELDRLLSAARTTDQPDVLDDLSQSISARVYDAVQAIPLTTSRDLVLFQPDLSLQIYPGMQYDLHRIGFGDLPTN